MALTARRSASERVAGLLLGLGEAASHSPCHAAGSFELPLSRREIAGSAQSDDRDGQPLASPGSKRTG